MQSNILYIIIIIGRRLQGVSDAGRFSVRLAEF